MSTVAKTVVRERVYDMDGVGRVAERTWSDGSVSKHRVSPNYTSPEGTVNVQYSSSQQSHQSQQSTGCHGQCCHHNHQHIPVPVPRFQVYDSPTVYGVPVHQFVPGNQQVHVIRHGNATFIPGIGWV